MSESLHFKCPCTTMGKKTETSESSPSKCPGTTCFAILLIVLGVNLLRRELTRNKTA